MGKIGLVTWREYITRVRKKSFLIMTIVGPLLIAGFYGLIIFLAVNDTIGQDTQRILVYDPANVLNHKVASNDAMEIDFADSSWSSREASEVPGDYTGRVLIPDTFNIYSPSSLTYESESSLSLESKERLKNRIATSIEERKMVELGVSQSAIDSLNTRVSINPLKLDESGQAKTTSVEVYTAVGMVFSFIIYFFIFLYGVQVMRGVIEEKTNRIVEVIISSVKPFQLMMGKVIGLALVGLTQIVIWVVLTGALVTVISTFIMSGDLGSAMDLAQQGQNISPEQWEAMGVNDGIGQALAAINSLNIPFILGSFIIYFLGGYLMYSALFAAVGAAVDAETDTQQFMLPLTMPLVLSIALSTSVIIRDPNSTLSFWLSIIPLTSPVAMMVRVPFLNVASQWWEVALSVGLLIGTFTLTIWLAGKIYRTGILMYGKKATYKELFKWLFYKS